MDSKFEFRDLFNFEKLIAPKVLKIVYWIGIAGISITGLSMFVSGLGMMQYTAGGGFGMMLLALFVLVFGTLFWRIIIEIYMVFFGIFDRLGDIRASLDKTLQP